MRIVFLGDWVGKTGRTAALNALPTIQERLRPDCIIANGENAAGGFGITRRIVDEAFDAGIHIVTSGNHAFDQRETLSWASEEARFLRPINFPKGTPGHGTAMVQLDDGRQVLVANIMGRVFMHPDLDDPFEAAETALAGVTLGHEADAIIIDFHAEATSEKQCFGHFLDGRVSLVIGTHTHIPTADHHVMEAGTAYMSDAGMCGDYNSSIGMQKEEPLNRFLTKLPSSRMEPATGEATVCGALVVTDDTTGLADAIEPIRMGGRLSDIWPTL
ncbi:MAG: TIGR00282 family metallophosphoesterase [Pseudomonadota bacterium]